MMVLAAAAAAPAWAADSADARVKALYDAEWAWRAKELGVPDDDMTGRAGFLPHEDPASQQRRLAYWRNSLAALNAIPEQDIVAEKINAAVFRTVLEAFVEQQEFRDYEMPFTSGGSFWASLAPRGPLDTTTEYRNYIGRMRDVPRFFDEQVANMRAGLKRGFTPPKVSLEGREVSITPFANPDPDRGPLDFRAKSAGTFAALFPRNLQQKRVTL
jgi:uncharacterized protein (DUF885 family)